MTLPKLYPILDTGILEARGFDIARAAAAFLEGGAGILQYRHKQHWSRAAFEAAREVARMCREAGAMLIVDDRADIAMLLEAGLHLGQDDLPPRDARRLMGTEARIGFSSHNLRQVCAAGAEPVDYLAFGPVFATASKRNPDPVTGIEALKECRALLGTPHKPLVAIGGITRETAREVLSVGADSLAVIADLLPPELTSLTLRQRMEEWQQLLK
jgi:thiamine-phosphate pyrophosphorylase